MPTTFVLHFQEKNGLKFEKKIYVYNSFYLHISFFPVIMQLVFTEKY